MGTHPIFESDFDCLTDFSNITKSMSDAEESHDEVYEVQDIIDDKIENGDKYYLIRWKGFAADDDTWESISNLECPGNIANYEKNKKQKKKEARSSAAGAAKVKREDDTTTGFKRGLKAEKIIGATNETGDLMFLMKWENEELADLVLAKEANSKCPQVVIKFYEERLTWHSNNN